MEQNEKMTAERSLEIITRMIEESRKDVLTGVLAKWLMRCGLATLLTTLILVIMSFFEPMPITGIWVALLVMFPTLKKKILATPEGLGGINSLLVSMWSTIIYMLLSLLLVIIAFKITLRFAFGEAGTPFTTFHMMEYVMLFLGLAVAITGCVLRMKSLKIWGIACGIIGFFWVRICISGWIVLHFVDVSLETQHALWPAFDWALIALLGMILPALVLKKKYKQHV